MPGYPIGQSVTLRLCLCFWGLAIQYEFLRPNRKWEFQEGGLQTRSMAISPCKHVRNTIPTAIPLFSKSGNTERLVRILSDVCKSKMAAIIGSRWEITHVSARAHDRNELPTSIPMFSGSGNTERLVRILYDAWVCWKSNMAHINLRWKDAIFNSQPIHTSGSLRSSPVV